MDDYMARFGIGSEDPRADEAADGDDTADDDGLDDNGSALPSGSANRSAPPPPPPAPPPPVDRRPPTMGECCWCHAEFAHRQGPGRKRIYCRRSCRQRAYERRRGLGVLPPPEVLIARPGGPLAHLPQRALRYEAGGLMHTQDKMHALRPGGYADSADRRATLCGLLKAPVGRAFAYIAGRSCETCDMVQRLRPPRRSLRVSNELAAFRSQLDGIASRLAHDHVLDARNDPELAATLLQALLDAA